MYSFPVFGGILTRGPWSLGGNRMRYSGLFCWFIYFLEALGFFSGTGNFLMVCTQIGNWSFILQDCIISWGKVNIHIYIYMYITTWFFICIFIYIYISFPRTSLNIPSRGKIIYFGIWFFIPKLEIHGSDPLSGTVWDVCWISGDVWSRGIFWVSPCFWTCSSWLMAWPWANQQWLPVFSSWWTWFFWECVLSEKSVTFKFTKSLGSTIKRGKDTYFFPQANNLKFADRHSKCDLKM